MSSNQFGRVDAENNVFVNDGAERKVGQYPGVGADEALAYFVRKFEDLAAQVRILEQRVANKVDSQGMKKIASKLMEDLKEPAAVGDLSDLRRRVSNLEPKIAELASQKADASKEAAAEALNLRKQIADRAEAIANQDSTKTQWKTSGAEMTELFERWQQAQKSGVKVSKSEADSIWKRFSSARTRFETAKRGYFAGLDATNKVTKAKKNSIVEAAEALAAKGSDDVAAYRKLLDEWKTSGRTPGKSDDALWARFKLAGDAVHAKKSEVALVENEVQEKNLATKLEILKDASQIDPSKDIAVAKKELAAIQQRWEKAGKVPKDKLRETEDKLRVIEEKIRKVEEDQWRKSDPAAIERSNSVTTQLEDSIKKLESALQKANETQDAKSIQDATEALDARRAWLDAVKASMV
jgi:hypothetical protein